MKLSSTAVNSTEHFILNCQNAIRQALSQLLDNFSSQALRKPIIYTLSQEGKRLRPLLTTLAYGLYQKDIQPVLRPSLTVELFHNFTLIHDDLMDKAPLRRGEATVHTKWDPNTAILTGDAILIEGYKLLAQAPVTDLKSVLDMFNICAIKVCEGQQMDLNFEQETHITEQAYMDMIHKKTGCLLGLCLALGGKLAGAEATQVADLQALGEQVGLIFQLKDDLLDVYGEKKYFGKRAGLDILSNKKTFLLVKALERAEGSQKKELHNWLHLKEFDEQKKIDAITNLYDQLAVQKITEQKIYELHEASFQHLHRLSGETARREALYTVIKRLISRKQ